MPKASTTHLQPDPPKRSELCGAVAIACVFALAIGLLVMMVASPGARGPAKASFGVVDLANQ